jgi:putative hydrolase of HD superfamily
VTIIDFLKIIEQFKTCKRTCRTTDRARPESDVEHSWHLATFLLLLEDEFNSVDFTKMLKIA